MKNLSLLVLALFPVLALSQTQTENYIKTTTYKIETTTSISTPDITQASQSITYFDGLGRPIQQIANQQSASGKDIVTPIEYDAFGRQPKDYLPYVPASSASLDYKSTALTDVLNFPQYSGQNPYSEKLLEPSPLNRVMKQAAPGTDWALNSGHEIKLDYQTNTTADAVKLFSVTAYWDVSKGMYDIPTFLTPTDYVQFQLYKTITYDENVNSTIESNGSTVEFKNKEGQVVLKRTYEASIRHDTYYVYDQFGNLTFVIPPLVDAATTISNEILGDLCYQYKYDYRNRLVEKKLPGKQWEFIVYDKLDRVVATGPTFSPFSDITLIGWLITKYDALNRVVYTGWENTSASSTTRASKQTNQNNLTTTLNESKGNYYGTTIDNIPAIYSNEVAPTSFKLLSVNYYDDYSIPDLLIFPTSTAVQGLLYKQQGLNTGTWTRILTTTASVSGEISATFYDAKARPIRTTHQNYLGGYTYIDSKLDAFSGQLQYTVTKHKRQSTDTEILVKEEFTYSPQDRLLTHTHQINSLPVQLLASNTYDELGQLISKNVGNNTTTPLQKVDYAYNIRGWMTEINKVAALQQSSDPKDLFGFKINYNTLDFAISTKALYNGNIAETLWSYNADGGIVRAYGYQYDNLNRLKDATYYKIGSLPYVSKAFDENLTYDKNGNILTLKRNGGSDVSAPPNLPLDDLYYTYSTSSNVLSNVYDNSNNNIAGFVDGNKYGPDFTYDLNGNLTSDKNKKITKIVYNHLNLPISIEFNNSSTQKIIYLYNANGVKIRKWVWNSDYIPIRTDYLDGFQYKNESLQYFPTAEGYVNNTVISGVNTFKYMFNYTDHLGNIRLSYAKNPTTNLLEILEESNYYPFGLKHSPSAVINGQPNYKYKYNGKELQDELGLNLYDYQARNYDPAIGRWMNMDPHSENYFSLSPYNYVGSNPIIRTDPTGMDWYTDKKGNVTYNEELKLDNAPRVLKSLGLGIDHYKGETTTEYVPNSEDVADYTLNYNSDGSISTSPGNTQQSSMTNETSKEGSYFDGPNSGEYGPSSMNPDAMSVSFNLNVNGLFFSANASAGLALTGSDAAVVFGGGVTWGPQTDLSLPGFKTGWNVSIHNGLGSNNDVLKGLGGNDAGNFGGFGLGGSYSKSLIGNSNKFDPNGVETLSLNIGPTFGLGQTKSTAWSGKFSDLLK